MEPKAEREARAVVAAFQAYRAARRAQASDNVADDVALARFRAYFPLATQVEVRRQMRTHFATEWMSRQRGMIRHADGLHGVW